MGENCPSNTKLSKQHCLDSQRRHHKMPPDALVPQIFACVHHSVHVPFHRSVVDPLGNAQVLGEHQDKSTQHSSIRRNTHTRLPQVECWKHRQVFRTGLIHESTHLTVTTPTTIHERHTAIRLIGGSWQTQQTRW